MWSFSKKEYDRRFERARELMAKEGIDTLLITQNQTHCYFSGLTGYDISWSRALYWWPQILIIPRDGEPEVIVHSIYEVAAGAMPARIPRTYIKKLGCACYDFSNVEVWNESETGTPPLDRVIYIKVLQERLEKLKLDKGTIGCELGPDFRMDMPFNDFMLLTKRLKNAKFVDGTPIISELRMIKSDAEVAYIRKACDIQDQAIERMRERLHEGMMGSTALNIMREEVGKAGGTVTWSLGIHFGGGPWPLEDAPLKRGDLFTFDIGTMYGSYHADYGRTWVVGKPNSEQIKDHENAWRIVNAAVEACAPGAIISDVAKISLDEAKKAGVEDRLALMAPGLIGHGNGISTGEPPIIGLWDSTPLRTGMVLCLEPLLMSKKYEWINNEQQIVITEDGYELLSKASTDFYQIR